MNTKALKYLFVLTPLCVWFYLGCAVSSPAVSDRDEEQARMMADAVAAHSAVRSAERDTAGTPPRIVDGASLTEMADRTDRADGRSAGATVADTAAAGSGADTVRPAGSASRNAGDTLRLTADMLLNNAGANAVHAFEDSVGGAGMLAALDSLAQRGSAIGELRDRLLRHIERVEGDIAEGVPVDSIGARAAREFAPLLDSLRAAGLELPPVGDEMFTDIPALTMLAGILGSEQAMIGQALAEINADSILTAQMLDTTARVRPPRRPFLDDPIFATSKDSMVYDVRNNTIWLYKDATLDYESQNLKGDVIAVDTETKILSGVGTESDSGRTRPVFTRDGQPMDMDRLAYNLATRTGIVRDLTMQEGEGYMLADLAKIHPDNHADMRGGMYTTCNHIEHPHFYIYMNRGKLIPNKKVIFGLTHFVLEDVPLYFPFLPFGFFPLMSGPSSGFIMPSFGEEYEKGFFLRDGGYYFRFGDYADATVTGSLYSLGSWDTQARTRYLKRYKFNGNLNFRYAQNVLGERGSADYVNAATYTLSWTHTQDPKFRPNSNFSASVNYASSGSKRYGSTTVEDYIQTQVSSSISYSKNFPATEKFPGGNITMAMRHSQNARDSTISFSFPEANWNISKFNPLKHQHAGKERWYEKISMSYSGGLKGSIDNIKERDLFSSSTLDKVRSGVEHRIPVSASFNALGYVNITGTANYTERWLFRQQNLWWDEVNKVVAGDTTTVFKRVYEYSVGASVSTKIFGMYQFKNTTGLIRAIRHVITPSVSISVKPDFGQPKFGFYRTYQSSADGSTTTYSPYSALNYFGPPSRGESATMSFSLQQNLEAKVRSERDTTGVRKIVLVESLSLSSGYNLLSDSMNLSTIGFNLSIPIVKNYKLTLRGTLDPYQYDPVARTRFNRFTFADGKMPRLTSASTGFNWSWAPTFGSNATIEQFERSVATNAHTHDPDSPLTPDDVRAMMAALYYDFSIPFNFGVGYTMNYSNDRMQRQLTHSIDFTASLTLTPFQANGQNRWAVSVTSFRYNLNEKKLTPGTLSVTRDLHCFVMSFTWIPIGIKSWSFNIRIKSDILRDIKYDKNRSYYEGLYD